MEKENSYFVCPALFSSLSPPPPLGHCTAVSLFDVFLKLTLSSDLSLHNSPSLSLLSCRAPFPFLFCSFYPRNYVTSSFIFFFSLFAALRFTRFLKCCSECPQTGASVTPFCVNWSTAFENLQRARWHFLSLRTAGQHR